MAINSQYNTESAFKAYSFFHAMKLHFTSKSYDYFKYQGKSRVKFDSFCRRNDTYHFYALSKKRDYQDMILSNLLKDSSVWIGSILTGEGVDTYFDWKTRKDAITHHFSSQLATLSDDYPIELSIPKGETYPLLYQRHLSGCISLETLILCNSITPFIDRWDTIVTDKVMYPNFSFKMRRYTPFVKYDKKKIITALKSRYDID